MAEGGLQRLSEWHKCRRTTGEVHRVNVGWTQTRVLHTLQRRGHHPNQQRLEVLRHAARFQGGRQGCLQVAEVHQRVTTAVAAGNFGLLHVVGHVVAQALFQHQHQAFVQRQVAVVGAQALCLTHGLGRVPPVNEVPGGQVKKHRIGHLPPVRPGVPVAQQGHDMLQAQALVKIGAANVHAACGQHVVGPVAAAAGALRPQAHHREVGRAATNVGHQHQAFALDAALVVKRCGNGLQLKADVAQACGLGGIQQHLLRQCIAFGVVVHKVHGAAQHHVAGGLAGLALGTFMQLGQKRRNDFLVAHGLAVDLGFLQQQRTAQQAFERAHQPPLGARQVLRHGISAKVGAAVLRIEKDGRGQRRGSALQLQRAHLVPFGAPCCRRVGSAKVNAQGGGVNGAHGCSNPIVAAPGTAR